MNYQIKKLIAHVLVMIGSYGMIRLYFQYLDKGCSPIVTLILCTTLLFALYASIHGLFNGLISCLNYSSSYAFSQKEFADDGGRSRRVGGVITASTILRRLR
jgi:hypothetical protein